MDTQRDPATGNGPDGAGTAPGPERPRLTVAVLTYLRNAYLAELLPALVEQAGPAAGRARVRILVVDNDPAGGAERTVGEAAGAARPDGAAPTDTAPEIVYVHEPEPGIVAGRNRALDESAHEHLLVFIDDDELPRPGWLAALLDARLRAMHTALDACPTEVPASLSIPARMGLDTVAERLALGVDHTVVVLFGGTGSGKSSLVRRIAREASQSGDWATPQLRIPSGTDPLKKVASALLDLSEAAGLAAAREKRIGDLLSRVETVAASGVSLSMRAQDGPEPYIALTDLLIEIGRAAIRRGDVVVIIHIDEVQNISDENALSQLLIALGDALTHEETVDVPGGLRIERALPIAVYLTGLPEFADMTGARKGATFARRFRTTTLGAIDDDALMSALQPFVTEGWPIADDAGGVGRVFMEPAAQRAIVELAHGEPFLFQLAGERAWYAGTDDLITAEHVRTGWRDAAPEAEAHVQRILDRLPPRERHFLEAMAALPPEERTLTNIARSMGYERTTNAGPTAQRLDLTRGIIRRGRPYDFRHRAVDAYLTSEWPWLS